MKFPAWKQAKCELMRRLIPFLYQSARYSQLPTPDLWRRWVPDNRGDANGAYRREHLDGSVDRGGPFSCPERVFCVGQTCVLDEVFEIAVRSSSPGLYFYGLRNRKESRWVVDIPHSHQQGCRLLGQFPEQRALYWRSAAKIGPGSENWVPGKGWGWVAIRLAAPTPSLEYVWLDVYLL